MSISKTEFGFFRGYKCWLLTLANSNGAVARLTNFGAAVVGLEVPDRNGNNADVVLGYDTLQEYVDGNSSHGATVGRYANRIGGAEITVSGKNYKLSPNDNKVNHLHGGFFGYNKRVWTVEAMDGGEEPSVTFGYISPDGEENYPGTLDVTVTYTWDDACNLSIRYQATTDKPTLCNLTNHTYFNLGGHDHGTIADHALTIDSDVITPVREGLIPTGGYMPVAGTPFDMRKGLLLGAGLLHTASCPQMALAGGYDHNFVLRKGEAMGLCACVYHEGTGRVMEVITDQPAVQLYTACTTNLEGGKGGAHYGQFSGLCLETQHCPDDPNNPQFPGTTVLRPGEKYDTTTIYAFRVEE